MMSDKMISRRFSDDPGFHGMLFLSLFIHALILSFILFLPAVPSPKLTFGPVYSVQLVSFSETFLGRKDTSSISGLLSEGKSSDRPIAMKKKTEPIDTTPMRKIETQKQDFSSVEKAVEKIRQRVSMISQPTLTTRNQIGDAEINMKMRAYYSSIWNRVKSQWALPQSILPRENIEAIVHAKVLRSGSVMDIGFEKRSGNRYFDESAMKAVQKAVPFSPLPEWIKDSSIEIGIRFHSSELR
jgi:colicin import membrane protein